MKRIGLFVSMIVLLTACNSQFNDLTEEAQVALGEGDFDRAQQLYEQALEEQHDSDVQQMIQAIEDYHTLVEKIDDADWDEALKLAEELLELENVPYAIKKEARDYITHIEEEAENDEQFVEQVEKIEQFIASEDVANANDYLRELESEELTDGQQDRVTSLKEQVNHAEQKVAEAEEKKREQERKEREEKERARAEKAEKMSSLKETYLQKAGHTRESVVTLEEQLNPVGTLEMVEFGSEALTLWDDLLNEIWVVLGEEMPKNEFETLRKEQRKWITEKESTAESIYTGTQGSAARVEAMYFQWDFTEERVYYLIHNFMN